MGSQCKVLHLSTYDAGGGAIRATMRLHEALLREQVESRVLVKRKLGSATGVVETFARDSLAGKLRRRLSGHIDTLPLRLLQTSNTAGLSTAWCAAGDVPAMAGPFDANIINLHWICDGFLTPSCLTHFGRKPLVWTAYDMWPVCGAEHYAGDSRRHLEGYHRGNRPQDESGFDVNRWVWRRKRKAWRNLDMTIVVATRWLAGHFRDSVLFRDRRIEIIPHGVDHTLFKPVDRQFARHVLNLPQDKRLILFGAMGGIDNRRKGAHLLLPALAELGGQGYGADTALAIFGSTQPPSPPDFGLPAHYLGRMDEIGLCLAYAAADIFVAPSMEDNLPLTVLEALACARPVVAFDIGGMLDAVVDGRNGALARSFDSADLARCLAEVLADAGRRVEMGAAGRRLVEEHFTLDRQARSYLSLYQDLSTP